MISRFAPVALALAVALTTSACSPQPDPEPTPAFSSEAEAFAAAEATYRAYVDALNQVDLSDPETFEDVYAWTTGDLNASDRENFSEWHAEGYVKSGIAAVDLVSPNNIAHFNSVHIKADIEACYDVSDVDVTDATGISLVSPDRPPVQHLQIVLVSSTTTKTRLALAEIGPAQGNGSC